ncbi:MAG: 6-carboxytetrahydropterin synthase [Candidatus Thermoplasmatota archaeon]|nr:6-carboxytetrahydropterin synthase [Candidatus Thermoplasmatota archaeon]
MTFSASHFIPGHEGCERLHGHSFAIHVKVEGDKGPSGMVMDFVSLKRALKEMARDFDHKMLIAGRSKAVRREGETIVYDSHGKTFVFPEDETTELDIEYATAENLAEYVVDRLIKKLDFPETVREVTIGIDEGGGQVAWVSRNL